MRGKELRKKIGQLFIMGFEGRNITPWVKELISRYNVAGVILFARNISEPLQVWELVRSFKKNDLLCAIDHEGGRVNHLPPPVTRFPALQAVGNVGSAAMAYKMGVFQGRELAALGFNLNFAPVLDVWSNPLNRVIADRSFSSDAGVVARLGKEYVKGLLEQGVAPCGKHFPGHGDTREDSHEVLPRIRTELSILESREFVPFREAISVGLPCVMTAHVVQEELDSHYPGTLSRHVIQGVLRQRLGFNGVVITDDLEMRGIAAHYDVEDRTLLALKAGVDLLMFCHTPEVQLKAIETAYRAVEGRILREEQIEHSVRRVQELKKLVCSTASARNKNELFSILGHPDHVALAASLAAGEER